MVYDLIWFPSNLKKHLRWELWVHKMREAVDFAEKPPFPSCLSWLWPQSLHHLWNPSTKSYSSMETQVHWSIQASPSQNPLRKLEIYTNCYMYTNYDPLHLSSCLPLILWHAIFEANPILLICNLLETFCSTLQSFSSCHPLSSIAPFPSSPASSTILWTKRLRFLIMSLAMADPLCFVSWWFEVELLLAHCLWFKKLNTKVSLIIPTTIQMGKFSNNWPKNQNFKHRTFFWYVMFWLHKK